MRATDAGPEDRVQKRGAGDQGSPSQSLAHCLSQARSIQTSVLSLSRTHLAVCDLYFALVVPSTWTPLYITPTRLHMWKLCLSLSKPAQMLSLLETYPEHFCPKESSLAYLEVNNS